MTTTKLLTWLVALTCGYVCCTTHAVEPPEAAALNGTWRAGIEDSQTLILRIDGQAMTMSLDSAGKETSIWSGTLMLSKQHPAEHMDWTNLKSANTAYPNNRCLYRLRGDTLIVMGGGPDRRPADFFSGPGAEPKALIFTRSEDEEHVCR